MLSVSVYDGHSVKSVCIRSYSSSHFLVFGKNNSEYGHFSSSENSGIENIPHSRRITAQKVKFSIKDFFSKCDQICSFLLIWSYFLKKSLMENFIFCAVHLLNFFPDALILATGNLVPACEKMNENC